MSRSDQQIPMLDLQAEVSELWDELNQALQRVLRSGQFILGPEVEAFEQEVATYLGVKHAIGVNSGTDALVISLRALGIGPGDEVITTPFSFFATAESISLVGAKPVFVDIDPETFNINSDLIEAAITERTRAIMPVHLFGLPAPMTQIMTLAQTYQLKVIEDCAQSFGARYLADCGDCDGACHTELRASISGKHTGSIGDVAAFSFYPTKNLGAYGDAGLMTTNSDELAETARKLRNHGSSTRYYNEMFGYNSRLDALQAAILRVKLPYIDSWNQQRRQVAARYSGQLAGLVGICTPGLHPAHVFHQYSVRIANGRRNEVQHALAEQGIASVVYYPLSQDQLPVYAGQYGDLPVSHQLANEILSLPIWPDLSEASQNRITHQLQEAILIR